MRRGEVWLVHFDPTVGSEIGKTRPAVIVSDEDVGVLPLQVIVPITKWQPQHTRRKWMVLLEPTVENGLSKRSAVDTFQVRSVSEQRMIRQMGYLSDTEMQDITRALARVMRIDL